MKALFKLPFIPLINMLGKAIERKRFTKAPIYIGACGRSGTTLLLSILSAHPDIFACPRELDLFREHKYKGSKLILPNFYRLYRTFIRERIKKSAKRYCEKSPSNIHYYDLIDKLHHGNFKLIHIIRDGRDVILSKHPRNKDEYWVAPERWIKDVKAGLLLKDKVNVLTVFYEDLVNDYLSVISEICNFLEIELVDEIINWHENTTVRENRALFSSIDEIHKSSVGKWKQAENSMRVKALTTLPEAHDLLKSLNYK